MYITLKVIKFVEESVPREINAVDVGVLELKTAITNLEASTGRIESQIEE